MSIQPIPAATEEGPAGAVAAAQRMQRLQALIASVEAGPASFAAQLKAAQTTSAQATAISTAGASTAGAGAFVAPAANAAAGSTYAALAATAATTPGAPTAQVSGYPLAGSSPALASSSTQAAALTGTSGEGAGYDALIEQAAARNGVDPAVLHGLIQQESGFDPGASSSAGALGLTQLMPGTAASLGVTDPLDPAQSIEGGARYLGQMMREFGGNTEEALAAYNAGPGAVQRYGGVPPYAETQQYVTKVLGYAAEYGQSAHGSTPSGVAPGQLATDGASQAAIA
jgi:soluble lytic murein transglycosylase-like protein